MACPYPNNPILKTLNFRLFENRAHAFKRLVKTAAPPDYEPVYGCTIEDDET
jgi:hypothetical protein